MYQHEPWHTILNADVRLGIYSLWVCHTCTYFLHSLFLLYSCIILVYFSVVTFFWSSYCLQRCGQYLKDLDVPPFISVVVHLFFLLLYLLSSLSIFFSLSVPMYGNNLLPSKWGYKLVWMYCKQIFSFIQPLPLKATWMKPYPAQRMWGNVSVWYLL